MGLLDLTKPGHVEVKIRGDGKVLWINVDGRCVTRLCQMRKLIVEDDRKCLPESAMKELIDFILAHNGDFSIANTPASIEITASFHDGNRFRVDIPHTQQYLSVLDEIEFECQEIIRILKWKLRCQQNPNQ